jgi:hypothetical protein
MRKKFEFPCAAEYVKQGGIYNWRSRKGTNCKHVEKLCPALWLPCIH